tara:strand:+ start:6034 stop:6222 length:189 start_codon:yes stop_codon:yes gene_type:complete
METSGGGMWVINFANGAFKSSKIVADSDNFVYRIAHFNADAVLGNTIIGANNTDGPNLKSLP